MLEMVFIQARRRTKIENKKQKDHNIALTDNNGVLREVFVEAFFVGTVNQEVQGIHLLTEQEQKSYLKKQLHW